jgi:hypothetical protein
MNSKQPHARRGFDPNHLTARDVLFLVPLILGISALFVTFAFLVGDDAYIRWGGLTLDSAVLIGYLLYSSRTVLRRRDFWAFFGSFLAVHVVLWIVVLRSASEWKLAWFGLMVFEAPVFLRLRDRRAPQ